MRAGRVNTWAGTRVERRASKSSGVMGISLGFAALIAGLGSAGCVQVDGGAVELSWSLRTFEGESITSCGDAAIARVRLCWISLELDGGEAQDGCRPQNSREFACGNESGITGFDLPPGRTSLFVQPICLDGSAAREGTYDVPAPIVRTVQEGKVVTLSSLLIVASDHTRPEESRCQPVGCTCVAESGISPADDENHGRFDP
jgi:hypothetical protein